MKVKNTLDLDMNQIIRVLLEKEPQHPSGTESRIYYNTTDKSVYYHDGTSWKKIGGLDNITNEGGGLQVGIEGNTANIDIRTDNATLEVGQGVLRIKDSGVTTPKIANNAVTTIKIVDRNITFSKINDIPTMTVIGRVASGTGVTSAITIINNDDLIGANGQSLATSGSIKAYVDSRISGIGSLIGGWDAMTNNSFPGDSQTKKGDYWYTTVAGTIQGVPLQVGDVIVSNQANPTKTNPNHYIFLQTNADQATNTILGMVMLASNSETQTGNDNKKAVTPASLSSRTATETRTGLARVSTMSEALLGEDDTTIMTPQKVKALLGSSTTEGYTALIGNGVATEIVVEHNLNTENLIAEFFDSSKKEKVLVDYTILGTTQVKVRTSKPLTVDELKIVIIPTRM